MCVRFRNLYLTEGIQSYDEAGNFISVPGSCHENCTVDFIMFRPHEREETERVIRCTLKEIMMSVDLDEVTSKYIRGRLEEDLDMDLGEFKPFIDQEMLTILGQMDAATEIFDHVYLGSEWNASNLEELQKNGLV